MTTSDGIRYKRLITHPSREEYVEIFRRVCEGNGIEYKPEVVEYLIKEYYEKTGTKRNSCHPRDIMDQMIDMARYKGETPVLSRESIARAWCNYFVEI